MLLDSVFAPVFSVREIGSSEKSYNSSSCWFSFRRDNCRDRADWKRKISISSIFFLVHSFRVMDLKWIRNALLNSAQVAFFRQFNALKCGAIEIRLTIGLEIDYNPWLPEEIVVELLRNLKDSSKRLRCQSHDKQMI